MVFFLKKKGKVSIEKIKMSEKSKNEVEFREKLSFSIPILAREARREKLYNEAKQIKHTAPPMPAYLPPRISCSRRGRYQCFFIGHSMTNLVLLPESDKDRKAVRHFTR